MRTFLLLFVLLMWPLLASGTDGPVQIGIVALDAPARGPADLLTAGLGARTNFALVERNELEKAVRERGLTQNQRLDVPELGRQLHAQALVLLETLGASNSAKLGLRLVTVESGVVLDAAVYPLPLRDPADWAGLAAARIARLQPKLQVPRERAVPISLLNLHAAISSTAGAETERALTTLLFHDLARHPEIFVLERRQLARAEWEKLVALSESQFWTGGYLLEGVIDLSGQNVAVNAQLIPRDNDQPVPIQVAGLRRDLPQLASQLAEKIRAGLRTKTPAPPWDRAAEAQRFSEECTWAARWGMWPEAGAAAEAAWLLGLRSEALATIRIKALLAQSGPITKWRSFLDNVWGLNSRALCFDPVRNLVWATDLPPGDEQVQNATEAGSWYGAVSRHPDTSWRTNEAWQAVGSNALATASSVLKHHYFYGVPTGQFHPGLAALREIARDLALLLPASSTHAMRRCDEPFWQDSPGPALESLRRSFESSDEDIPLMAPREVFEPWWVAWTAADRAEGERQWQALLASLARSTNRAIRARAATLNIYQAKFDPDLALAQEQFLEAVMDDSRSSFDTNVSFSVLDRFDQALQFKCSRPPTLRRARLQVAWANLRFARIRHYLLTARSADVMRVEASCAPGVLSQEQARELLPILSDLDRRMGRGGFSRARDALAAQAANSDDPLDACLAEPVFDAERFRRLFVGRTFTPEEAARLSRPLRALGNRLGWPQDVNDVSRRLTAILEKTGPPGIEAVGAPPALVISRTLSPMMRNERGEIAPAKVHSWLEYKGKIFAVATPFQTGRVRPLAQGAGVPPDSYRVIELDPATGQSRTLPQDITSTNFSSLTVFQVDDDHVFVISGLSTLAVVDRHSSGLRLHDLDLPLYGARLLSLGKRLFIVHADYIAEFLPASGTTKLLASKRRKPAVGKLDSCPAWSGMPRLWSSPGQHGLLANVGGTNLWSWNPQTEDWDACAPLESRGGVPWTLTPQATWQNFWSERVWADGGREVLLSLDLSLLPQWPLPLDHPWVPGRASPYLNQLSDGTNLWVIRAPYVSQAPQGPNPPRLTDRDLTLLWFQPRWEMPWVIPVRFASLATSKSAAPTPALPWTATNSSLGIIMYTNGMTPAPGALTLHLLPAKDLSDWLARNAKENQNLPRREPARRARFDANGDGRLDAPELQAMDKDAAWQLEEERAGTRRFLLTFDENHNDSLEPRELEAINNLASREIFPASRRPPAYIRPARPPALRLDWIMATFDANHDNLIAGNEVLEFHRYLSTPN